MTDQSSIIRFIEDNWLKGQRLGDGSFDALAGPITSMFDFNRRDHDGPDLFLLNQQTGEVVNQEQGR